MLPTEIIEVILFMLPRASHNLWFFVSKHFNTLLECKYEDRCKYSFMRDIIELTASEAHLDILIWVKDISKNNHLLCCASKYAAKYGHMIILKWLQNIGDKFNSDTCNGAAEGGHLDILKWLVSIGVPFDNYVCTYAAKSGIKKILKWCIKKGATWTQNICGTAISDAACNNHFDLVKWIHTDNVNNGNYSINGYHVCFGAARNGNFDMLIWAREYGYIWSDCASDIAAEKGHIEILKWAKLNNCYLSDRVCYKAALHNQLAVLQWARNNGCEWNIHTSVCAAYGGNIEVLKWVYNNGCKIDSHVCSYAAYKGHFELLQWIRSIGCSWTSETCACAVLGNHFDILKWAVANGCDIDAKTYTIAIKYKRTNIIKWYSDNGYEQKMEEIFYDSKWAETYFVRNDSNKHSWIYHVTDYPDWLYID